MVGGALILSVILKTFFVQAFYIPSESMVPTLLTNDKVLVQKVSYWRGEPERGDVVVFRDSAGWLAPAQSGEDLGIVRKTLEVVGLYPSGGHLIKRVVDAQADSNFHIKVPQGYLWVQGDNRGNSADSRAHMGQPGGGFVPVDQVVGKSWLTVWPFSRIGFTESSDAFDQVGQ